MKKVYFDTNVILDFLLARGPFHEDIAEIIEECFERSIEMCISAASITDLNYIIGKSEGTKIARVKTAKVLDFVKVESVSESLIKRASKSNFKDFEDAVQNYCAEESKHKIIVTRNVKDFKESRLVDMSAIEAVNRITERYLKAGKTVHLRHLSQDCQKLLKNADKIIDVNVLEDPHYKVVVDKV